MLETMTAIRRAWAEYVVSASQPYQSSALATQVKDDARSGTAMRRLKVPRIAITRKFEQTSAMFTKLRVPEGLSMYRGGVCWKTVSVGVGRRSSVPVTVARIVTVAEPGCVEAIWIYKL